MLKYTNVWGNKAPHFHMATVKANVNMLFQ